MARSTNPRSLLTPAALHILLSLARGEKHGYAIKQDVEERTRGSISLGPGTLYEAIHRMRRSEWITEVEEQGAERSRRKVYQLTRGGRKVMEEELRRLGEIVRQARAHDLMPDLDPA